MGKIVDIRDGIVNFVSRLGTGRDKAAWSTYDFAWASPVELTNAYRGSWAARKIVDIPAFDSCRAWRSWQAKADEIEKLEAEERRLGLQRKVLEARIKARLYGGAALIIGDGYANPEEPLNVNRIGLGGLQYVTVVLRRRLTPGDLDRDPRSPTFDQPLWYTLDSNVRIHPSRLAIFRGVRLPDERLQAAGQEWGDSVLIAAMSAMKQADSTMANIASLIFEAKVDVINVPQLGDKLSTPDGEGRLLTRFGAAATAKGINGTLMLDTEETYTQKSASFAQLPEISDRFMQQLSAAADIPATRFLGQSPAGMNATGESDLRNYYDRIAAEQNLEMTPALELLDECLIRSALGVRPPEVHHIWSSLWSISDKERMDIGYRIAETVEKLNNTGLYPQQALADIGANMMVEHSIAPGFAEAIEGAGGLPDYEAELEAEQEAEAERVANALNETERRRLAANDGKDAEV